MRVKIGDLRPNPFRDIASYPFDQQRINILTNSLKTTGFWDNILARKHKGNIEMAYGHHRKKALEKVYGKNKYIDIPVKGLDDASMLKIMANENETMYEHSPKIIIETVRQAKKYLEKHPGLVPQKLIETKQKYGREVKEISVFLGGNWNERKVSRALTVITQGTEEIVEKAPTLYHAEIIARRVPTPKEQKEVLREVIKGKIADKETKERRPLTVDETEDLIKWKGIEKEVLPKRKEPIDLSDVIKAINDHLNTASVLISKEVVKHWTQAPERQKRQLLFHLSNFIKKIKPLYKKDEHRKLLME